MQKSIRPFIIVRHRLMLVSLRSCRRALLVGLVGLVGSGVVGGSSWLRLLESEGGYPLRHPTRNVEDPGGQEETGV